LRNLIMKFRIRALTLFATLILATLGLPTALAQAVATSGQLTITGDIPKPLALSLDDLRHQQRITVKVPNEHQANTQDTYEGVPLATLLKQTGMPQGSQIKGAMLATYLMAEGSDGYRVIFSLAEVDSDFQDSGVIVADTMNGEPLSVTAGPLKLVVPHDKRPARSVRMLQSIKIVSVPK